MSRKLIRTSRKVLIGYNKQQPGLGRKFHAEVKVYFKKLKTNPFYQLRYGDVRCLPIKQIKP